MSEASAQSVLQQMGMPALAGGIAVCFSHPLELTKVRLQLDNERGLRGEVAVGQPPPVDQFDVSLW